MCNVEIGYSEFVKHMSHCVREERLKFLKRLAE